MLRSPSSIFLAAQLERGTYGPRETARPGDRDLRPEHRDTIRDPLLILDRDLCVRSANRAFYKTFQASPKETENRSIQDFGDRQWDIPPLLALLREIVPAKGHFDDYEVTHDFPKVGRRTMLLNARKLYRPGNRTVLLVLAMEDITERKKA